MIRLVVLSAVALAGGVLLGSGNADAKSIADLSRGYVRVNPPFQNPPPCIQCVRSPSRPGGDPAYLPGQITGGSQYGQVIRR